jgi:lipid A 3-O-deacylase
VSDVSVANGADLPPPAVPTVSTVVPPSDPWVVGNQFEARFGAFYYREGAVNPNSADLGASFLTPRLNVGLPGYWANFLPRLQVGASLNLTGKTSFAYVDGVLTLPITPWLFFEPFLGGAIHDGSLRPTTTENGLGCRELFHAGVSVGVSLSEHWNVLSTFEHLSNGKTVFSVDCGTNQAASGSNQGLNLVGVRVGYLF